MLWNEVQIPNNFLRGVTAFQAKTFQGHTCYYCWCATQTSLCCYIKSQHKIKLRQILICITGHTQSKDKYLYVLHICTQFAEICFQPQYDLCNIKKGIIFLLSCKYSKWLKMIALHFKFMACKSLKLHRSLAFILHLDVSCSLIYALSHFICSSTPPYMLKIEQRCQQADPRHHKLLQ